LLFPGSLLSQSDFLFVCRAPIEASVQFVIFEDRTVSAAGFSSVSCHSGQTQDAGYQKGMSMSLFGSAGPGFVEAAAESGRSSPFRWTGVDLVDSAWERQRPNFLK
jgi:hypothetical protein